MRHLKLCTYMKLDRPKRASAERSSYGHIAKQNLEIKISKVHDKFFELAKYAASGVNTHHKMLPVIARPVNS